MNTEPLNRPGISRRRAVAAASAFSLVPSRVLAAPGRKGPNDKLVIAGIGVGGVGRSYLAGCASEEIAFLCDVDPAYAAPTFKLYPKAKVYTDYRAMLDKEKGIDAVVIGTPDHTHAAIALAALEAGKHVYCAKPLTRTIAECRRVTAAARKAGVATQMSVQSCASDAALQTVEWIRAGAVGRVREVHVWTDRPVWPQALARPSGTSPVPAGLDWKAWLGPAPARPYHSVYHPFNWRGWCDFGTGGLGDMACHAFHVVFGALDLTAPLAVHASSNFLMEPVPPNQADQPWMRARKVKHPETFPASSVVTWEFPQVRMTWWEGGLRPPRPAGMDPGRPMPGSGLLFLGENGASLSGFPGGPWLAGTTSFTPPPKTLPRTVGHYQEWIAAAKGGSQASCPFDFGAQLTEVALLGVIAIRTGRYLEWDAAKMRITNDGDANRLVGA